MKRLSAAMAALALSILILPARAAPSGVQVDNNLATGDVSIYISAGIPGDTQSPPAGEIALDETGQNTKPYANHDYSSYYNNIMPGEYIYWIAGIVNNAEPVWVRVAITERPEWLTDDCLYSGYPRIPLLESGWERHGDYYYWPAPIDAGYDRYAYVSFMDGFQIPGSLGNEYQNTDFNLSITAEAVQSANFTPDFSLDDPWFGTVIEACAHTEPYDHGVQTAENFEIIYEHGAQGLIKTGDDFFSEWPRLMPGDTVSGTAAIKNNYQTAEIFFHTESIGNTDAALLGALNLKIQNGEDVIYNGPLSGTVTPLSLGEYKPGDETELVYTVTVPAHLDNRYAMRETATRWVFDLKLPEYPPAVLPVAGGPGVSGVITTGTAVTLSAGAMILIKRKGGCLIHG